MTHNSRIASYDLRSKSAQQEMSKELTAIQKKEKLTATFFYL